MTSPKPIVKGPVNGNIFAVVGACRRALLKAGLKQEAKEIVEKVTQSGSYDEALQICMEYVDFDI